MELNKSFNHLIFWALFVVLAVLFYHRMIFLLPQGIHEWAQADRLALAMQFYDRGFNFFEPRTYNLNSVDGITGVEFPIQAYLAALLGGVFGRDNISIIFRGLNIAITLTGCYFLFRLLLKKTGSVVFAIFPGIFFFSAPVVAYYSGTYLPDTAATSILFIALYYFDQYYNTRKPKTLIICLAFFILATLIKTTCAIYFFAAAGFLFLWGNFNTNTMTAKAKRLLIIIAGFGILLVVSYTFYNRYLNQKYNSKIFLAGLMPIEDLEMYNLIIDRFNQVWRVEYFTDKQYFFIGLSLFLFFIFLKSNIKRNLALTSLLAIGFIGAALFFKFMGAQIPDHDYYVIASFYPLIIILIILMLENLYRHAGKFKLYLEFVLVVCMAVILYNSYVHLPLRLADKYKGFSDYYAYTWMRGGAEAMKAVGSDLDDKILVLSDYQPNLSLVYFDRRGIVWHRGSLLPEGIDAVKEMMDDNDLKYIVIKTDQYQNSLMNNPALESFFAKSYENEQFVLLKPVK